MKENERNTGIPNPTPQSPLEVLQFTIREVAQLELEYENNVGINVSASTQALVNKARAIAALPGKLEKIRETGIFVSGNIASFADEIAAQAERWIATDNLFGLSVLLIPKGSKTGDPNLLEEFVSQLGDEASGKRFKELVNVDTNRDRCIEIIKGLITSDEVINIASTRDEAAEKVVESLAYLGVFAPAPATFDKTAFEMTGGFDADPEASDTMWNFFLRTDILNDESAKAQDRVSISEGLTTMLLNPLNGFFTDDE